MLVSMLQLQCLNQPLNVGKRSSTELQVAGRIGTLRKALLLDTGFDAPNLSQVIGSEFLRVSN